MKIETWRRYEQNKVPNIEGTHLGRNMRLFRVDTEIEVVAPAFRRIVPRGFVSDGSSIPRWAWFAAGHPYSGQTLIAAIVHDYLCVERDMPHEIAHGAFYDIARACGEKKMRAWVMHKAIKVGGPKW